MTTIAMTNSSPINLKKPLLVAIFVVIAAVAVAQVINSDHALGHSEAVDIRQCLNDNGPYQTWKNNTGDYFRVCHLPDGRWGFQVVKFDQIMRQWVEKTAFVKGGGSWSEFIMYMARIGAARFTGALP